MSKHIVDCPYCGSKAEYRLGTSSKGELNFNDPKEQFYVCSNYPKCDTYVRADIHGKKRGSLANRELRRLRMMAHYLFDQLWLDGLMTRTQAYNFLWKSMGLPKKRSHIGEMNEENCRTLVRMMQKKEVWFLNIKKNCDSFKVFYLKLNDIFYCFKIDSDKCRSFLKKKPEEVVFYCIQNRWKCELERA